MATFFKRGSGLQRSTVEPAPAPGAGIEDEPIPVPEVIESDPDTAWAIWKHTVETQDNPFESTESAPLATQPGDLNTQPAPLETHPLPLTLVPRS